MLIAPILFWFFNFNQELVKANLEQPICCHSYIDEELFEKLITFAKCWKGNNFSRLTNIDISRLKKKN